MPSWFAVRLLHFLKCDAVAQAVQDQSLSLLVAVANTTSKTSEWINKQVQGCITTEEVQIVGHVFIASDMSGDACVHIDQPFFRFYLDTFAIVIDEVTCYSLGIFVLLMDIYLVRLMQHVHFDVAILCSSSNRHTQAAMTELLP